jgi:hypothetical protein
MFRKGGKFIAAPARPSAILCGPKLYALFAFSRAKTSWPSRSRIRTPIV